MRKSPAVLSGVLQVIALFVSVVQAERTLNCSAEIQCAGDADEQSEILADGSLAFTFPSYSVDGDFQVIVELAPFVPNENTSLPIEAELAALEVLSLYINRAFVAPITVTIDVGVPRDSLRRRLSDEPVVHWYRRDETSWKPLCDSSYDSTTNTVSAEVPLNVLTSEDFKPTRRLPALFAAFYVETTLTCFIEPPPPTTPEPEDDKDWRTDWEWDDLTAEQLTLVIMCSVAAAFFLTCCGFLAAFLACAGKKKPSKRTLGKGPTIDTGRLFVMPPPIPPRATPLRAAVQVRSVPPQVETRSLPPQVPMRPAVGASTRPMPPLYMSLNGAIQEAPPMGTARSIAPLPPPPPVHYEAMGPSVPPSRLNSIAPAVMDDYDYSLFGDLGPHFPPGESTWEPDQPIARNETLPPMDPNDMYGGGMYPSQLDESVFNDYGMQAHSEAGEFAA